MTASPPQPVPPSPRRRSWRPVAYGVLLLAGVFAAWQAHELVVSVRETPAPPRPPAPERRGRGPALAKIRQLGRAVTATMPSPAAPPSTAPWDFMADSNVQAVPGDEDPIGIDPPVGAALGRAHRAPDGSVIAHYDWIGVLADAARHYEKVLGEAGSRALSRTVDEQGRQYLSFEGPGRRVAVVLRSAGPEGKIVSIDVTVIPLPE